MVFASTARAMYLQSARLQMRIPSIKFRKGGLASGGAQASVGSSVAPQVNKPQEIKQVPVVPEQVQEQPAKGGQAGPAPAMIILQELPSRYQRKPMSQEEIDYINGGGIV